MPISKQKITYLMYNVSLITNSHFIFFQVKIEQKAKIHKKKEALHSTVFI